MKHFGIVADDSCVGIVGTVIPTVPPTIDVSNIATAVCSRCRRPDCTTPGMEGVRSFPMLAVLDCPLDFSLHPPHSPSPSKFASLDPLWNLRREEKLFPSRRRNFSLPREPRLRREGILAGLRYFFTCNTEHAPVCARPGIRPSCACI